MAVFTPLDASTLRTFLKTYNVGELISYHGIAEGIENSTFLILTTQNKYILTLFERRIDRADLPYFHSFLQHLQQYGLPCPVPLTTLTGTIFQDIKGKPAVLVPFLEGTSVQDITLHHCAELGHTLAKMHTAAERFPQDRPNTLSLPQWKTLCQKTSAQADTVTPHLGCLMTEEVTYLEQHWPKNLPKGTIHADLFPDNVFFKDEKLSGLIDFYFACTDFFAYDLAICLNAWCFDLQPCIPAEAAVQCGHLSQENHFVYNKDKGIALLQAYHTVRPLTKQEQVAFPTLCRGAAMRFLCTRLEDWLFPAQHSTIVMQKDPQEYVDKLMTHQNMVGIKDYGFKE